MKVPECEKGINEPTIDSPDKMVQQPGPSRFQAGSKPGPSRVENVSTSKSTSTPKTSNNKKSKLPEIEKLTIGKCHSQSEFEGMINEGKKEAYQILSVTSSDKQKENRNHHLALATLRDVGINMLEMFAKSDVTSLSEFRNFYNQFGEKQIELIHKKTNKISKPTPEKLYIMFQEKDLELVAAVVIVKLEKAYQFGNISDDLKEAINIEWSNIEKIQVKPRKEEKQLIWRVMISILEGHTTRINEENPKRDFVLKFSHYIMQKRSEAS